MTVSSELSRKTYAGNGVTTSFATSPMVFVDSSDLTVYVVTNATGVAATLVENADYSVTGGSNAVGTISLAGGSAPYGAPATGTTLVIKRSVAITQGADLVNNDSSDAEVQETALDKLTMIAQQNAATAGRALRLSDDDTADGAAFVLPTSQDRGGLYLAFDAAGLPVVSAGTGTDTGLRTDLAASTGTTLLGTVAPGTGAPARTLAAKSYDIVSVKDAGAVADAVRNPTTGVVTGTDNRAAFQKAVDWFGDNAGCVYIPPGDYAAAGVTSDDSGATKYKNIIHIPQLTAGSFHDIKPINLVGNGGATIYAMSDDTVIVRTSRAHCQHSGITLFGGSEGVGLGATPSAGWAYPNTIGWAFWPDDTAAVGTQINQAFCGLLNTFAHHCREGHSFFSGPAQVSGGAYGNGSALHYFSAYSAHTKECDVGARYYKAPDYGTTLGTTTYGLCTTFQWVGCHFNSGNCGHFVDGIAGLQAIGCRVDNMNQGTTPCGAGGVGAGPCGYYVAAVDHYNHVLFLYGGACEGCTASIENNDATTHAIFWEDVNSSAILTEPMTTLGAFNHDLLTWATPAFSAGSFSVGPSAGGWTVAAGDVKTWKYTIINKTMTVNFKIDATTITGTPGYLKMDLPLGKKAKVAANGVYTCSNGGWVPAMWFVIAGGGYIGLYTDLPQNAWGSSAGAAYVCGSITFEIE